MDSATLVTGLVTVAVGALSGGITNAVAIWMLFHPYEARGFWRFRLHGAIPKNKARLARSIGKTVGERLLTPEDLAERLSAPQVRETFDAAMYRLVDEFLDQRHGPLRDALPPAAVAVLERIVEDLGPRVADRLAEFAGTPAFCGLVARWLERLRDDLADRPVGHLLTPARREALAEKVDEWVGDLAEGPEMEGTIRAWVEAQVQAMERDSRPLSDRLPPSLLAPVEQAIADYLPTAIDQVSGLLGDPETRGTVSAALRSAFDGAARQLLLHERLLAKLVVKETTFERLLDGLERSGFDRFAAAITAPEVRERVAAVVHRAFLGLLRMPLGERLARLGPEKRAALTRTIGDWVVAASRSPSSRVAIRHGLERALDAAGERTWGEVFTAVPAERVAEALTEALGSEGGRAWVADTVRRAAGTLLEQPIGRPADWLGPETSQAVRDGVAATTWGWVQTQIPAIVARLRLPEMVEQKVLGFSTQRMEEIIRGVTERELQLIVRLGYVLGAFVGLVAFGIDLLIR